MSGYEEQLHARAELLDDAGDLGAVAAGVLAGASGAGLDPAAVTGLRAAVQALDPAGAVPAYHAGSRTDRRPGGGYGSDAEFLEAICDAAEQIRERAGDVKQFREQAAEAREKAAGDLVRSRRDLAAAQQDLAAAYALPVSTPCDGCHRRKVAAIDDAQNRARDAEERIRDATRRIGILDDATELLEVLGRRLGAAAQALRRVPSDLGEVYELVYAYVARGGKLPHFGRWIEGGGA